MTEMMYIPEWEKDKEVNRKGRTIIKHARRVGILHSRMRGSVPEHWIDPKDRQKLINAVREKGEIKCK